jgi:hypothetical protein
MKHKIETHVTYCGGTRARDLLRDRAGGAFFILVNSDGCGVFVTQWGRIVSSCGGLQPSELFSPPVSHGAHSGRRLAMQVSTRE